MKKIILLSFTFCGIYCCLAQQPAKTADSFVVEKKPFFRLYPNPAKHKIEIEIKAFEPGFVIIQLINNEGKLLREEKRLALTGNENITVMFSEKPGLYFLFVKQGKTMLKNKLVIQ